MPSDLSPSAKTYKLVKTDPVPILSGRGLVLCYNCFMMFEKFCKYAFVSLVFLTLLTPLVIFRHLLFPYITDKAFFFRSVIELAMPFYLYLIFSNSHLRPNLRNLLTVAVAAFFVVNLIAALFGADFNRSFWGLLDRMDGVYTQAHFLMIYFYLLLLSRLSGGWLEKFLKALVGVSTLTALNGISGYLGGPIIAPDISLPDRASSTLGNPIFFASFLIIPLCLSAFFALSSEKKNWKVVYSAAFILQLLALVFSGTRGAVVGVGAGIFAGAFLYLISNSGNRAKIFGGGLLAVIVFAVGGLIVFRDSLSGGLNAQRLLTFNDSNTKARVLQWGIALKGIKDHPFLGTGPGNYSVISNKYYTPEIWQYDKNWFDKPHNYQLEILTTSGILGGVAYLFIVGVVLWLLYRAFKVGLLNSAEACILTAGFVAYQVQNLFVFDTISASQAFYIFLAFAGYLWSKEAQTIKKQKIERRPAFQIVFVTVAGLALFLVYATNFAGYKIAKNLNLAKLFQNEFPVAKALLDESSDSRFNVYLRDTAYEYSNFAAWYSNRNQAPEQIAASKAMMIDAIAVQERAALAHPEDPTVFLKWANALLAQSHLENSGFNQKAYDTAYKAYQLVPKRYDPRLLMATIAIDGKRNDLAEKWLNEILADYPSLQEARWQLADLYYFSGRQNEAVSLGEAAVAGGYKLDGIKKGDWLLTYYYGAKQPQRAVDFLLTQKQANEKNGDYYARLADAYNKSGDYEEARKAALKLLELEPASKADVEAFLDSLPK